MNTRSLLLVLASAVVLALASPPSTPAQEQGEWGGELGMLGGHHDNFFYRGPGADAPSSSLFSLLGLVEYDRDVGSGTLGWSLDGSQVLVLDIDDADYETTSLEARYKRGRTRLDLSYGLMFNRLYAEEGDAVFFDTDGLRFRVRYTVSQRVWIRGQVELEEWDFDPAAQDRDSDVTEYRLTIRGAINDRVALRGSYLNEDRDAVGADNNRSGDGFALALESQPRDDMSLFVRIRRRDRQYEDAPEGDSNFQRDDTVDDLTANFRWFVRDSWGLQLVVSYRDGESTRPDRNFDGAQIGLGLVYRFGRGG